jgi:hypothetical protein
MILHRSQVPRDTWDAFVTDDPAGWVWHLNDWCDYLAASGREDRSHAQLLDGRIVGLCPALFPVPPDDPLPVPLGEVPSGYWSTRSQPHPERTGPGFATCVLDLSLSHADLWRGIRRSYHALIHRAEERYTVGLLCWRALADLYEQQPDLPQITPAQWACIARIYDAGRFLIFGAMSEHGDCVGAIGLYYWKGHAYYGHGRSLVPNVNHLLHWHAIKALPSYGVQHYEIGWEARPEDDEKARAIAFHKQGFGGDRWWVSVT